MSDTPREMPMKRHLVPLVLALGAVLVAPYAAAEPGTRSCASLAREIFGVGAARLSSKLKAPKKVRNVKPAFPDIPSGTKGSGVWVADALIAPDGRVRQVVVLRDLDFTPPFPEFSKSISDAVRLWRYSPPVADGKDVPLCMTVSVNVHWQ